MLERNPSQLSRGAAWGRSTMTPGTSRILGAVIIVVMLGGTIPLMGQSKSQEQTTESDVVAAQTFVLQDASGRERGEFSIKQGMPCLSLLDKNGTCRMRLSMCPDGSPAIALFDADGRDRGLFRVSMEGEPGLVRDAQPAAGPVMIEEDPDQEPAAAAPIEPVRPSREAIGLFSEHCASCHGADGSGADGRAEMPRLPDFRRAAWQSSRPDATLLASIINGRGTEMPPFQGEVTDAQARELVAVVRAFGPEPRAVTGGSTGDFTSRFQALEREFEELEQRIQSLGGAGSQR